MADRKRYNRFIPGFPYDSTVKYNFQDYVFDNEYLEFKPRDIWVAAGDPPYIVNGLGITVNGGDPLKVDIGTGTAFDKNFVEVNVPTTMAFPLFDITSGVINYLTVRYNRVEDFGSNRPAFRNPSIIYNAATQDSYKIAWKLAAPVNPEQTGTIAGPYNLTPNVNNVILFSTDQSLPEYNITLSTNVASVTGGSLASGSVELQDGINDTFVFTVDTFDYNLDLTALPSEILTLSGVATRINTQAFLANALLVDPIAFVISGENRLRITSPRDLTPIIDKKVNMGSGNANATLGFVDGDFSLESDQKTAADIVAEINTATFPEVTSSVFGGNRVRLKAFNPDGFLDIQAVAHSAYSTLGLTPLLINGAESIDLNNDIILAAVTNVGMSASIDYSVRTHNFKLIDSQTGWEHQTTIVGISGEPDDVTVLIPSGDYYVVGANELEVFRNGQRLYSGKGYDEIGIPGDRATSFTLNATYNNDQVLMRRPSSAPSNVTPLEVSRSGQTVLVSTTKLNFAPEFGVTDLGNNEVQINIGILSGDAIGSGVVLANHGHMHEFGGSQEIDVTNLTGLLLEPQKINILVRDALSYATRGVNFKGNRFTITNNAASGYVNVELNEKIFVDDAGDACIRLGFDGGSVFSGVIIEDQVSGTWFVTVDNDGQLNTEAMAGSPQNIIVESPSGGLYQLGIEAVLGSGEITTQLVVSGVPLIFSLEAPNGKGWGVRVEDNGEIFTLDPDNVFKVQDANANDIFKITENGVTYLHKFVHNAVSGSPEYLPPANESSGGIATYYNSSGELHLIMSDGSGWLQFEKTPLIL